MDTESLVKQLRRSEELAMVASVESQFEGDMWAEVAETFGVLASWIETIVAPRLGEK